MKRRTTVALQRLRLSWSSQPSLALIVLVTIALVLQLSDENILPVANGQRAIASLGTKLKKQLQATSSGDGRRRRSSDNDDIENDQMIRTAMLGGNNDGKVDVFLAPDSGAGAATISMATAATMPSTQC